MSVWKRRREAAPSVEARIRVALVNLAPRLRIHEADIELVEFEAAGGVAVLRFEGDCPDCRMSASVLRQGIEAHLRREVPEIRTIRAL
ncbi:MAG: NifU family protein [Gemmatimonadaceae bacterium]